MYSYWRTASIRWSHFIVIVNGNRNTNTVFIYNNISDINSWDNVRIQWTGIRTTALPGTWWTSSSRPRSSDNFCITILFATVVALIILPTRRSLTNIALIYATGATAAFLRTATTGTTLWRRALGAAWGSTTFLRTALRARWWAAPGATATFLATTAVRAVTWTAALFWGTTSWTRWRRTTVRWTTFWAKERM